MKGRRADRGVCGLGAHPGRGGTFVELEMGMQAGRLSDRLIDPAIGRQLLPALESAVAGRPRRGRARRELAPLETALAG